MNKILNRIHDNKIRFVVSFIFYSIKSFPMQNEAKRAREEGNKKKRGEIWLVYSKLHEN